MKSLELMCQSDKHLLFNSLLCQYLLTYFGLHTHPHCTYTVLKHKQQRELKVNTTPQEKCYQPGF